MRHDGRAPDALRPIAFERNFTEHAAGSVLVRAGRTHVLCTASIVEEVPPWREPSGVGWLTAEYDMLPGATDQRRARNRNRVDGRTQEIQRLIGRSLRVAVDLTRLGPRTIYLDCDVLQADGGTRTAAITGAYLALRDALSAGQRRGYWDSRVLRCGVAAVSVGKVESQLLLDLDYREDVAADVDANLVMTSQGHWIEVQATAEGEPLGDDELQALLALGRSGIRQLLALQEAALRQDDN
jgi:ribonuclease PH